MPEIRFIIQSTTDDQDAARELSRKMTAFVRDNEPGTTTYNWYFGEDGSVINEDEYVDTPALQKHLANAGEAGHLDEFMSLLDIQSVRVLGAVDDAARRTLADFGAVHYDLGESL